MCRCDLVITFIVRESQLGWLKCGFDIVRAALFPWIDGNMNMALFVSILSFIFGVIMKNGEKTDSNDTALFNGMTHEHIHGVFSTQANTAVDEIYFAQFLCRSNGGARSVQRKLTFPMRDTNHIIKWYSLSENNLAFFDLFIGYRDKQCLSSTRP